MVFYINSKRTAFAVLMERSCATLGGWAQSRIAYSYVGGVWCCGWFLLPSVTREL